MQLLQAEREKRNNKLQKNVTPAGRVFARNIMLQFCARTVKICKIKMT